jgi:hypothetical protein
VVDCDLEVAIATIRPFTDYIQREDSAIFPFLVRDFTGGPAPEHGLGTPSTTFYVQFDICFT